MPDPKTRNLLLSELRKCTAMWNRYEDIPLSQQARTRELGELLYMAGREELMREAYYDAKRANPAAHMIQAYWDGIGDWRW